MEIKIKIPESLALEVGNEVKAVDGVRIESITTAPPEGGSSFEPFTTLLIVVAGYAIFSRLLDFIMDLRNPGVIILLDKKGNLSVETSPGIPNAHVLFLSPDGKKEMFKRKDIGEGLLQAAIAKYTP